MTDTGGRVADDDVLAAEFGRLATLAGPDAPDVSVLQLRVRRRRIRRRAGAAATMVAVLALAVAAVALTRPADSTELRLSSQGTTPPPASSVDPVFTIGEVPEGMVVRDCGADGGSGGTGAPGGITCTIGDPVGVVDGVRVTRVIGGATEDLIDAWESGDARAAVTDSGGFDGSDGARFITFGATEVLDLTGNLRAETDTAATSNALRVVVGADLIDIGSSNVASADLATIIDGLSLAPPAPDVEAILRSLPDGSSVLVQGSRRSWTQPSGAGAVVDDAAAVTTWGAVFAVPGSAVPLTFDRVSDIDAPAVLDELLVGDPPGFTETQVDGLRAVELGSSGRAPELVPLPRSEPQLFVQVDDSTLFRLAHEGGTAAELRAIAEALR